MPVEARPLTELPAGSKVRCLVIVARDRPDLWNDLRRDFTGGQGVRVILDRRKGERRQRAARHRPERRRGERRQARVDRDLRYRSFVIIHEQQRVLSG